MKLLDPLKPPYDLRVVWAVVPFALLGMALAVMPLRSWDYWWHISIGRLVAAHGEVPKTAMFLYSMPPDSPSYVQPWLAQLILYELHETFGLNIVLVVRTLIGAFAWLFLTLWAARRAGNVAVGSIAALAAAVFGFFTVAARTHLLAWPLFLVVMPIAYMVRAGELRARWLVAFPIASLLWANLHGAFFIPGLVCLAFVGAEIGDMVLKRKDSWNGAKIFGGTLVASVAATIVNPRGLDAHHYVLFMSRNPENLATVTEFFPTTPVFPTFYGGFFYFLLAVMLVLWWRQRDRVDLVDVFLFLGFSALAILASRALLWVGLTIPFAMPRYLSGLNRLFPPDESAPSRASQMINAGLAGVLSLTVLAMVPWSPDFTIAADVQPVPTRTEPPMRGLVTADTPIEPAMMLKERGMDAPRVYHDNRTPGFLIWALDDDEPTQMVYLDNRVELATHEMWRRFDRVNAGRGWRELAEEFEVTAFVANKSTQEGLVEALRAAPDWQFVYENDEYVLALKGDP